MNARSVRLAMFACAAMVSSTLGAQDSRVDSMVVKTMPLQYLSNADAAKLVSPYVAPWLGAGNVMAGVFEAGNAVHAITVRSSARVVTRVDSILRANDRPPATVALRLQVIAASDSAVRDASISELDSELHNLFRFNGYRLLSQNTVWVNDGSMFSTTMRGPNGQQVSISGEISGVRREGTKSVRLEVSLSRKTQESGMIDGKVQSNPIQERLLQTGLTIPIGQTVVVGSAMTVGSTPAIILTVRPELAVKP
jgi:hypothetical protein